MLVAFAHLRWNYVWQRPQQLLSRFARHMPVLYVEEPEFAQTRGELRTRSDHGVTVATPVLPSHLEYGGFGPRVNGAIAALIEPLVPASDRLIVWYYTPMALGAEPPGRQADLSVYDAMDDLASFQSANSRMRNQENRLLRQVDLVFAGGPSLYQQRLHRHPAVSCFPSGVEAKHFASAKNGVVRPMTLAARPRPIIGYFGVIDERIDLDLIAGMADLRPVWTIALVGPIAKINPHAIPARQNIVRFGQQTYADLPRFLACFDIAMMPFARNDATRSISPTKTLEYLAGGRPVVSTPIKDVIDLYGDLVTIASTPRDFITAIDAILHWPPSHRQQWEAEVARAAAMHEWDDIARRMLETMEASGLRQPMVAPEAPAFAMTS